MGKSRQIVFSAGISTSSLCKKSKSLLAVHCSSRFTFVVWDMTIADWGLLADTAANGIRHSLQEAGISKDNICRYFEKAGPAELTKTHGRREVAFLNRAWEDVITLDILTDQSQQWQTTLSEAVNDLPRRCAGREGQQTPAENLLQDFQERLSAR